MKKFETLINSLLIKPEGESMLSELVTIVTLADEGGGLFVKVRQENSQEISIQESEWPLIKDAIDTMIAECAKRNKQE